MAGGVARGVAVAHAAGLHGHFNASWPGSSRSRLAMVVGEGCSSVRMPSPAHPTPPTALCKSPFLSMPTSTSFPLCPPQLPPPAPPMPGGHSSSRRKSAGTHECSRHVRACTLLQPPLLQPTRLMETRATGNALCVQGPPTHTPLGQAFSRSPGRQAWPHLTRPVC